MGKNDGARWFAVVRCEASGSGRGTRAGRRFMQGLLSRGAEEAANCAGEGNSVGGGAESREKAEAATGSG